MLSLRVGWLRARSMLGLLWVKKPGLRAEVSPDQKLMRELEDGAKC